MRNIIVILFTIVVMLSTFQSKAYIPMVEEGKEWGYAEYIDDVENIYFGSLYYYRLFFKEKDECSNIQEYYIIDGTKYFAMVKDNSFISYNGKPEIIAYMREEEGKVYVRYPREHFPMIIQFYEHENTGDYSAEYLLYDFNMEEGDCLVFPNPSQNYPDIVLKCIEAGYIDSEKGPRKYMRFEKKPNSDEEYWLGFDFLVEGVGPVGNCLISNPFNEPLINGMYQNLTYIDLLYQRGSMKYFTKPNGLGGKLQGDMLYKSPFFEALGVYDPSVWFWPSERPSTASVERPPVPPTNIFKVCDQSIHVTSSEPITELYLFDITGKQIRYLQPNSQDVQVNDISLYGGNIVIARVVTASGSRTFKFYER